MKKILLYTLVVIKNATIIIPFFEGMISALVNMIEQDNKKKEEQNGQVKDTKFTVKNNN